MVCESYHVPVMLKEAVDGLDVRQGGVYVDVTFGGGGHSREILRRLGGSGHLYSFDQDADAIHQDLASKLRSCEAAEEKNGDGNFTFVHSNFRFLKNWMRYHGVEKIDGLLADLGVSSHHFDDGRRGFSFRFDAPLDMRMNRSAAMTAADVVNGYDESRLSWIMRTYGEVRDLKRVVGGIVRARSNEPIRTTGELVRAIYGEGRIKTLSPSGGEGDVMEMVFGGKDGKNSRREGEMKKELARVFQALRIEVNGEMKALEQMLMAAQDMLAEGGRLVVLTYHSLEDRMVKNVIRSGNIEGVVKQDVFGNVLAPLRPMGKALAPSAEEQEANPRSRSARLRVGEKVGVKDKE